MSIYGIRMRAYDLGTGSKFIFLIKIKKWNSIEFFGWKRIQLPNYLSVGQDIGLVLFDMLSGYSKY